MVLAFYFISPPPTTPQIKTKYAPKRVNIVLFSVVL